MYKISIEHCSTSQIYSIAIRAYLQITVAATIEVNHTSGTQSNVAGAGTDFVEATGQLIIAAGESSGEITVEVLDDTDVESEELVLLNLTAVSGARFADGAINETAAINILDNESVISVPIVADDFTVIEGDPETFPACPRH